MRLFVLIFIFLHSSAQEFYCPSVATKGADRRPDKSSFRVVQFNAEWLYLDGADKCPGVTCPWPNVTEARKHITAIAGVISDLNPDVINLCEVESCHELTDLLKEPTLSSKGFNPYMVLGKDSATGQDVGMLTKLDPLEDLYRTENRVTYPIVGTKCNSTYTGTSGVSKHYITSFNVNGLRVAMIATHLLAFPDDQDRCVQREAQATVLAEVVQPYVDKGFEIIIIGDLNDFEDVAVDRNFNLPISKVASILKGAGQRWNLQNVALRIPQSERYTDWWDSNNDCVYNLKEVSSIDHILVSPGLVNRIADAFVSHTSFTQSCKDFYFSDHWPVVVDFRV